MPISIILQQQDQEEVEDGVAEDPSRGEDPGPEMEVEVERSLVPDSSPPSPPPSPSSLAPADTAGPSYTAQQSQEHVHVSSRELAAVMDAVYALATTKASLEACLYFGWEEKLEVEVSSIMFCIVFSFINCLLIFYRIV